MTSWWGVWHHRQKWESGEMWWYFKDIIRYGWKWIVSLLILEVGVILTEYWFLIVMYNNYAIPMFLGIITGGSRWDERGREHRWQEWKKENEQS